MDKLKMHSPNLVDDNIDKIKKLFPNCITENKHEDGNVRRVVDFDLLRQELSNTVVEGPQERYTLNWPGKNEAILAANVPIAKTLRPCEKESVDYDTTQNLFIEGDNLDVLKLLQETYLGKVKMIYIDPPYNTGKDILYKNDYTNSENDYLFLSGQKNEQGLIAIANTESNGRFHSNWLSMIYPRIKMAKNLLREDGIITIAIDHNELNTLTSICDEVFGNENRIGLITVVHKPEGRNQAKFFGPSNDFMLFYAKDIHSCSLRNVVIDDELIKSFDQSDSKGLFKLKNFIRLSDGKYSLRVNKPSFYYPVYFNLDTNQLSITPREGFEEKIFPITDSGQERTWKTTKETFKERYNAGEIIAVKESNKWVIYEKLRENQVLKTHWLNKKYHGFHFGTKLVDDLLKAKTFDFPKSLYLVLDVLKITTSPNDIILDFFAGSATTAHAVIQLNAEHDSNCKFIMVQLPEACDEESEAFKAGYKTIAEISKERIRRAGKKIKEENPLTTQNLDIGFRVFKVDSSNMKDVYYTPDEVKQEQVEMFANNIKEDRSPEDILFQVFVDWGLELTLPVAKETIEEKTVFFVDGNVLAACFDTGITEKLVKILAKRKPLRAVFRDDSYGSDSVKINVEQIFKLISPATEVKSI